MMTSLICGDDGSDGGVYDYAHVCHGDYGGHDDVRDDDGVPRLVLQQKLKLPQG